MQIFSGRRPGVTRLVGIGVASTVAAGSLVMAVGPAQANYPPKPGAARVASSLNESVPSACPTSAPSGTVRVPGDVGQLCRTAVAGATSTQAAGAIRYAFAHLGAAYSQFNRDSVSPPVYDCSSLVGRAFRAAGARITRGSSSWNFYPYFGWTGAYVPGNYSGTNLVRVTKSTLRPGDIIIQFNGPNPSQSAGNAGHAQIYLGSGYIIQSSGRLNVNNAGKWSFGNEWYFRYVPSGQEVTPTPTPTPTPKPVVPITVPDSAPVFYASHAKVGVRNAGDVRSMQRALIAKKYATQALRWSGATGNYLTQTKLSVANLQRRLGYRGADADGIIGPYSARALGLRWVNR
jgi:cell wall-associated NlpC family hydrolase